jgi:O-antigen/teichoic acid export membrane protein
VSGGERTAGAVVAAAVRHVAGAAAGLIVIPLVARRLGADALGIWALLGTGSFLVGVSDLGLSTAVQRAAVRSDDADTRRVVGLALLVVTVVAPLSALASLTLLLDIPGTSPAIQASVARSAVVVLVAGIIAAVAFPFRGYALAKGGIGALARARGLASGAQVAVTWLGLTLAPSLLAPALGLLCASMVETGLTVRAARSFDPELPVLPRRPRDARELVALLKDGAAALAVNLGGLLALRFDVVILSRVSPLAVVAAYGVGSRAVDQCFTVAKQVSAALLPRLGDPRARERAVRLGTALLGALVASGMAALSLGGRSMLVAWAGPVAARPEAAIAITLLAIAAAIAAGHEVVSSALMLGGTTPWESAGPIVAGYIVNLGVSILAAPRFGVWAVAGGTLLGNTLTSILLWDRGRRLLSWSLPTVGSALAPLAAAGCASATASLLLSSVAERGALWSVSICVATTVFGCGAAVFVQRRFA